MLGLLLRLSTPFGNQAAKGKTILLSLHSPLPKYSFLAIPPSRITSDLLPLTQLLASPALDAFLEISRTHLHLLTQIGRENFGFAQLIKLEEGQQGQSQILSKNSAELKTWASSFAKLTEVVQSQINRSNFSHWMEVCLRLELIDVAVWGVLLRQCAAGFGQLPPSGQLKTIQMVHRYVNQKFMKFTYAPSRFVYRENALVDLGNLPELLTIFAQAVVTAPAQQARSCFAFLLELAFKVSKTCLVNFMTLLNHYSENEGAYLQLLKDGPLSSHIHLLRFYALVGLNDRDRLCSLDNSFLEQLNSRRHSLHFEQIFEIVASWSSLSHHNTAIHQNHIRPAILRLLKDPDHRSSPKWTTLLFDLLGAGVEDLDIQEALLGHIAQNHPIDSKIMHTINHYLSVKHKSTRLSSYPLCEQHPVAKAIASSAPKVYSPCMVRQRRKDRGHSHQDITYQKQIGIENNPPQSFWLQALQEVFQELSAQRPHPNNGVYYNFPFCVFELDALIVLGNRFVAFELAGTHYLHKDEKGQVGDSWQGKKQIKNAIVQAYGIIPCDINSSGLVERTISSFQDYSHARKYLRQKLLPLLKAD